MDGGHLAAERIGPEPVSEDGEPHCSTLRERSLGENGKYPMGAVGTEGADSAVQAAELAEPVAAKCRTNARPWPEQ